MVAPFVKTLIKSGSKYDSLLVASSAAPENVISELMEVYKATAFMLRSIATILKIEKKPLFGAFNTRQVTPKCPRIHGEFSYGFRRTA